MGFFLEVVLGGLMAGVLYSLVALGFVLIFKASGVFNFAQGAMVLFAALAMARLAEWLPPMLGIDSVLWANLIAFAVAVVVMIAVAWAIERVVLQHPKSQQPRGYFVQISADGQTWQEVARKADNWLMVDVAFPPAEARYVRVETTNTSLYQPWGIADVIVWESAPQWLRGRNP